MSDRTRDTSIDSIKFILIILVIFGHALEVEWVTNWDNLAFKKIYTFIYSFHMPAFIILSGYFFHDMDKQCFWKGIANLFMTYLIFQVLLFGDPLAYNPNNGCLWEQMKVGIINNIRYFYRPSVVLWYIVSLIFWRIMLHIIPVRIRNYKGFIVGVALVVSLFVGFIPLGKELSFQRTFVFFPYFLLGYYQSRSGILDKLKLLPRWSLMMIIVFYCIAIIIIPHIPFSMLYQSFSYLELDSPVMGLILRVGSYIWVLPLTISVLILLQNVCFFAKEGRKTLFYYIYHMYFIYAMRYMVLTEGVPSLMVIILYVISMVLMLSLMSKIKLLNKPLHVFK